MINNKLASYCALDISAGGIYGLLARVNAIGEIASMDCFCGNAAGVEGGRIINSGAFVESLSVVIKKLEEASVVKIKSALISFRYAHLICRHSTGIISVCAGANKVITSGDVSKVNEQAYTLGLNIDEEVLYQIPQGYAVDNQNKVMRPEGLYGRRLEADLFLVSVPAADYKSVVLAVNCAGVRVESIVFSGLATSLAVLSKEEKEKGASLLDIGFDSSQLLIFKDGILRNLEIFNFGWGLLVRALKDELRIPYELAQDLAASYGNALSCDIDLEQEVLIKKDQSYSPVKRKLICAVIEKQLQEIFRVIKERLTGMRADTLSRGLVICGKMALLEGFLESCEKNINIPVCLAKIEKSKVNDINYAGAVGLVNYALASSWHFNPLKLPAYGNIFRKIAVKSKELYQEYF